MKRTIATHHKHKSSPLAAFAALLLGAFMMLGASSPAVATPAPAGDSDPAALAWAAFLTQHDQNVRDDWSTGGVVIFAERDIQSLPAAPYPSHGFDTIIVVNNRLENLDGLTSLTHPNLGSEHPLNLGYFKKEVNASGILMFANNEIRDIEGLRHLTSAFIIDLSGNNLTKVDGLASLNAVRYRFDLHDNALEDINGLVNLRSFGGRAGSAHGELDLSHNQLTDVDGLVNLSFAGGNLNLSYNPDLTDLSGLSRIQALDGNIYASHIGTITVPIAAAAWLCQPRQADNFYGITQNEACGL
ncbi:MAG: hypothetical protein L0H29_08480 [Sinobacteraceae bacterium]|nr:hypothetical protein [Nevskiaceae bacterium]